MRFFLVLFFLVLSLGSVLARKDVRMMSFNIHNGVGMDRKNDIERVGDVINRECPDVVAIQEVDSVTQRGKGRDLLRELAGYTLMYRVFAPAIAYQGGKYGIGVLAKTKPLSWRYLSLPGREEERVLLIVEFADYVFCATHFSLTEEDQLASVVVLERELQQFRKPVFLAGDLNALPDSRVLRALQKSFVVLSGVKDKTFPADQPKECLDYILGFTGTGETYAVMRSKVVNEPMASDHRPVVVDVALRTPVGEVFRTRPYLQNPVGEGITVSWLTNAPVYSWVEYGVDSSCLRKAHRVVDGQVICNNYIHKVRLDSLKPGDVYYYRVCSKEMLSYRAYNKVFGDTVKSRFYSFRLPDVRETDFTVVVFNDIHKRHGTLDALFRGVESLKYDFVVFNGDCIDDPANEEEAVRSLSYFNDKVNAACVPVFYLRGNHEIRNAYSIELRELFDYVGDRTYGAFSWGSSRFVMLDCGEDKPDDHWVYYGLNDFTKLRRDQVGFLEAELKSKAFRKAEKRVLLHHIPVYGETDKYNPCLELWGGLLKKAPFSVAVNAHTHRYAFYPKGSVGNNFPLFVGGGYSLKDATVIVLEKRGRRMTIRVLNAEGSVLKEMVL